MEISSLSLSKAVAGFPISDLSNQYRVKGRRVVTTLTHTCTAFYYIKPLCFSGETTPVGLPVGSGGKPCFQLNMALKRVHDIYFLPSALILFLYLCFETYTSLSSLIH